jgi:apolipoprotein N-acyltransferase
LRKLRLAGASALSGALLFLSDHPVHAWPLVLVAFLPFLLVLRAGGRTRTEAAMAGALLAAGYVLPTLVTVAFPPLMAAALAIYAAVLFVLLALLLRSAIRLRAPAGPLAAGAAAAFVEWLNSVVLPAWGTAQSWVRVTSAAPEAIQLVALTGFTGIAFVLVALAAAVVQAIGRLAPARALLTLAAVLAAAAAANAVLWREASSRSIVVAAIGWTEKDIVREQAFYDADRLARLVEPPLAEAARREATLVVTPETGLDLHPHGKVTVFARLSALAKCHRVTLAFGYFNRARNDNRVAFFGPDGSLLGEYVKTHLIHSVERYTPGDGTTVLVPLDGLRLGGMVCQDDNFTDLSRAYARRRAQVLAVPTNDWRQVKDYHLESGLLRAVETRAAVVRAASNGVSAIVSPRGEVLARRDHFSEGAGLITADVPVGEGGSLYGTAGDWLPLLSGAGLAAGFGLGILRRRRRKRRGLSSAPDSP